MPSVQNLIKTAPPCVFTSPTHTRACVCIRVIKNLYMTTTYILQRAHMFACIQKQKIACLRGKDVKFPFTTYARIIYILCATVICRPVRVKRIRLVSVGLSGICTFYTGYAVVSIIYTYMWKYDRLITRQIEFLVSFTILLISPVVPLSNTIRHEHYTYICIYTYTHTEVI